MVSALATGAQILRRRVSHERGWVGSLRCFGGSGGAQAEDSLRVGRVRLCGVASLTLCVQSMWLKFSTNDVDAHWRLGRGIVIQIHFSVLAPRLCSSVEGDDVVCLVVISRAHLGTPISYGLSRGRQRRERHLHHHL